MLLGLIGVKNNDVVIGITSSYFLNALFDQELNFEIISQLESCPCPDKQGTPEEGRRIQRPKRWITTNNNKDEGNSPKNNAQNIAHQASSQKFRQIILFDINHLFVRSQIVSSISTKD